MTTNHAHEALVTTMEPVPVVCMKRTDTSDTIAKVGEQVLEELTGEIDRAGLQIGGPTHLLRTDCRHERRPLCILEWCIPIAALPRPLSLSHGAIVRTLHSFRCVKGTHHGAYSDLPKTVEAIVEAAEAAKVHVDPAIQRHVYVEWDGFDSTDNVIEVQIAVEGQPPS